MERETIVEGVPADSVQLEAVPARKADTSLQGSILVLIQFDVAEEIRLDELRKIFSARTKGASFKHPAPGYVQYQRPPVVEPIEALVLDTGERLDGQIKYYDYGVLSVVFELPFTGEWDDSGPDLRPLGMGHRLHGLGFEDCYQAPGTRQAGPDQAVRQLAARGLLHFPRARDGVKPGAGEIF